ncbi:SRPBCC family protein [Pseudonocardia acidicola]|uniref:SRPBCC family protein n=1 Tax=Pseudonocardia acidicola TaxID=2724939 RepID=A0ABX1SCG9_9PSEU|nr:SRPBCC family protein [Pseudonocardia acidicola]NMH97939.1 SRPBCC family protein [Pseudonocardia acidicola]
MEWTGQRYADTPTVQAQTYVEAPPQRVWELVSDIELMPQVSTELQSVEWLDGATGPAVGHTFRGHNAHQAIGEWSTTSHVIECEALRAFAWAVEDPACPTAVWRFTLQPEGPGTVLRQWMQMGPGRSGLNLAIDRMPDREQKIVHGRLCEIEAGIEKNLAEIKRRAETA